MMSIPRLIGWCESNRARANESSNVKDVDENGENCPLSLIPVISEGTNDSAVEIIGFPIYKIPLDVFERCVEFQTDLDTVLYR